MFGLDDHADAARMQVVVEPVGDLLGEAFLHLGAVGEEFHHAGEFGQSENAVAGQVSDVRDADERQQVMLADRPDRDGARQDELVVRPRRCRRW